MLTEEQLQKFTILCGNIFGSNVYIDEVNLLRGLYSFDNNELNIVFSRLHQEANEILEEIRDRILKRHNLYMIVDIRNRATTLCENLNQICNFFKKNHYTFSVNKNYNDLFVYILNTSIKNGRNSYFDEYYIIPELVLDEPIFYLTKKNAFTKVKYLIFGADKTKPDIIIKNLLDGEFNVINEKDVLVYDNEIGESFLYKDLDNWWKTVANKYKGYHSSLNEIEQKVSDFYKNNYRKDSHPVLIPQVYMHYDPKNQKFREQYENGKVLTFQRMDFLILYKGKRVIIEIDGKEHFQNSDKYSKQCKYDRDMKFLGYDVFRLGGAELTDNFDATVKEFFDNLYNYLEVT